MSRVRVVGGRRLKGESPAWPDGHARQTVPVYRRLLASEFALTVSDAGRRSTSLASRTDHTFHRFHRYIFHALLLCSALIVSAAILAWDVHGLVLLIRWMWAR